MDVPEPFACHHDRPGSKIWTYLIEDVRDDIAIETELVLLAFATGIQDAATWPDYGVFASNQTGNTLFLAIGVAGLIQPPKNFANIGMSLGCFVAGGLVMGQLGNYVGSRRRIWLLFSNLFQTALVYGAAVVQYAMPLRPTGPSALGVIAMLAFSSGGQVAMSRGLKVGEITTAMATAAFVDVVVDPKVYKLHNRKRNRRVMFLVVLTAGCFAGAFAQRGVNSPFTIILSGIVKSTVQFLFFFNRCVPKKTSESE